MFYHLCQLSILVTCPRFADMMYFCHRVLPYFAQLTFIYPPDTPTRTVGVGLGESNSFQTGIGL